MSCSNGTPSLTFSVSFSLSPLNIRVSPLRIVTVDLTEVFDLLIWYVKVTFELGVTRNVLSASTLNLTKLSETISGLILSVIPISSSRLISESSPEPTAPAARHGVRTRGGHFD